VVDRPLLELLHEDDRELTREIWRGFKKGVYPRAVDLRLMVPEREEPVVCSCSFAPLPEEPGIVIISFMDVTEQRRTEADLLKTMEFLESLVEASVDGIIAADMTGTIMLFNPAAERIYGFTAAEVVGKMKTKALYPEGGAREVMRRLRSPDYGGIGRLSPTVMEAIGKSGEWIPVQLSAAMIYENGEPVATFGIFTDLREKMQAERNLAEAQAKLAQSERQALVAEVAGAAAHELNQPLTAVMACADLLSKTETESPRVARAANVISSEVQRMAEIVKKIGSLTRYETKDYVGEQRILDLDRSSMASEPPSAEGGGRDER
ncbi:MAG TPA: PAS domain S-box protein, partial [Planctomycetota bacterium]|nr:PAS domain S-box protein [Planctomycetota bacterium]